MEWFGFWIATGFAFIAIGLAAIAFGIVRLADAYNKNPTP